MSQAQAILEYLKQGNSISPLEALHKFGCFRLGARIWDLKQAGYNIQEEDVKLNGKRFAKYTMVKPQEKFT